MMIQSKTNNHLSLINNHLPFGISTLVESALQIGPFMQNEPNFRKSQMNVTTYITKNCEDMTLGQRGKNEPKTNPIKANQTQLKPIKCQNKPNTKPIKPNFKGKRMMIAAINRRFGSRFLLTKQAFFYSIESLETNTYNGLMFKLYGKTRGLSRIDRFLCPRLSDKILEVRAGQKDFCVLSQLSRIFAVNQN